MTTNTLARPWFGPHKLGWGWSPATPEGWVVTAVTVLAGLVASRLFKRRPLLQLGVFLLTTAAVVTISMATGTRPGSRLMGDTVETTRLTPPAN